MSEKKQIYIVGHVTVPFVLTTEVDVDTCVLLDDEFSNDNWTSFAKDRIGPRNLVVNEIVDIQLTDIDIL